ncbi:MAG: HlyD family secretion protein [Pirellula sp.]|jgi:multidrug resistance efflux pump
MAQRFLIGLSVVAIAVSLGTYWWNTSEHAASSANSVASVSLQRNLIHPSNIEVQLDEHASKVAGGVVRLASAQEPLTLPPSDTDTAKEPAFNEKTGPEKLVSVEANQDALPPATSGAIALPTQLRNVPSTGLRVPSDGVSVPAATRTDALTFSGVLSFVNDVWIPAQTDGIIQQLLVDEGSVVQADSVLIELDSRLANAEVQVAENEKTSAMLKAEDDSQIKFSEASLDVAKSVLLRSQQLYETGVETRDDLEKKNLERIKAGFQVDVSKREQKINQAAVGVSDAKLNAAKVQVELRTIKAPFSGMVAETQKERFEWVKAGDQILRLVSLEKFRVRGFVLLEESPNILEGAPARVTVPIGPGKVETIDGVVGFVKPESVGKKQSGNEYVVWVEMPNRMVNGKYLFRGGMDAKVEIYPQR